MKTNVQIIKAFNATWLLLILLSLFHTGVARSGVAIVESRAHGAHARKGMEEESGIDTLQKMEFLQREIQELRGKVEEQTYQLQQLKEHQKKLYADLDKRLRGGTTTPKSGIVTDSSLNESQDEPITQITADQFVPEQSITLSSQDTAGEEKAYLQAYRLIQSKDYDGALTAFKAMIQQTPQGKYTPNAQYWLGEIYLTKGNLAKATESFDIVYHHYPQHPKAADSLLKLGYVEYTKGQWKRAGELLNQVKNQFPGSTSAQLADSRLQKMQLEGHLQQ
ncbi:MAG: tol-pal system protein YbgF [Proteobacteria bacterium]|nr:tol-pal system protein YbgF [Pseudomonadota bacterium]